MSPVRASTGSKLNWITAGQLLDHRPRHCVNWKCQNTATRFSSKPTTSMICQPSTLSRQHACEVKAIQTVLNVIFSLMKACATTGTRIISFSMPARRPQAPSCQRHNPRRKGNAALGAPTHHPQHSVHGIIHTKQYTTH